MATKIDTFKSQFSDLLRPNLYAVYIFPKVNFANQEKNRIGMLCHETSFPFHTFTTNSYRYNNLEIPFINKIDYDPVTFTFYVDRDNVLLNFFDKWRQQIIDEDHRFNYFDNYTSRIEIEIFDRLFQVTAVASIIDAFPVNISPINLGYSQNDTLMTMQVSFQFKQIEYEFYTVQKQKKEEAVAKAKSWKDWITLGNIRRGINMISKIKSYRRIIQNPNAYDIAGNASKVFKVIKKAPSSSTGTNYGRANIVSDASKLFK